MTLRRLRILSRGANASRRVILTKALQNQLDEEEALEHWLRTEVVAGHEEYMRDPSTGKTLAQARAEILGDGE
jgi:predicted transcriptional regulator